MKKVFIMSCLIASICCACIANATEVSDGYNKRQINAECIDKLASKLIENKEYSSENNPSLDPEQYKKSIKETIKMAMHEKIKNEKSLEHLRDIFDDTIGETSTENYLMARWLFRYMIDEKLSLTDAVKRLKDLIDSRISDVETFAKQANIENVINQETASLLNDLSVYAPEISITPAKDIFKLIKSIVPSTNEPSEAINIALSKVPSLNNTEVLSVRGNVIDYINQEKQIGSKPIAVNWRNSSDDGGHLSKYVPGVIESLKNADDMAKSSSYVYSENLDIVVDKSNSNATDQQIDLITCKIVNGSNFQNDQEIRELIRMQSVIAIVTGHDSLMIDMIGFNVSPERLAQIGKIYSEEINNPLVRGKLKKIFFIKEK